MHRLYRTLICTLLPTALFALTDHKATATVAITMLTNAVTSDAIAPVADLDRAFPRKTRLPDAVAQAAGTLLLPEQKARLTRLPIPIVAPTYLPAGFRLLRAEGEASQYANGDDDSGYAIDYQGANNTCLSLRSSKDGSRGLTKVKQVQTNLGWVTIYTDTSRDRKSLVSFLGIKGNPILISGSTLPDKTATSGWKPCRAVSVDAFTQVLKSLVIVK
ncbi:MAG: hypothetical protein RBJ76_26240 [Stenomitos frigidus ULC029]